MTLDRGERIKYVRTNLASPRPNARRGYMTHDDFAEAVGAPGREGVIAWEKGRTPRDYAEKIAVLTPYPAAAFGAPGEAELVRETLGIRLAAVEDEVARLRQQTESFAEAVLGRLAALEAVPAPASQRSGRRRTVPEPGA